MSLWKRIVEEVAPRGADPVAWAARHSDVIRKYAKDRYGMCPHLDTQGVWCLDCNRRVAVRRCS